MSVTIDRICQTAVLVQLRISQWTRARQDKRAAQIAEDAMGASRKGRYTKYAVPEEATRAITKAASAAREQHYQMSAFWDEGLRLLPVSRLDDYRAAMSTNRVMFEAATADFFGRYPDYETSAREALGDMYDPRMFPSLDALRDKYRFKVSVLPVAPDDFRVALPDQEREALVRNARASAEEQVLDSVRDTLGRVMAVAEHVIDRLGDPDAIFRDTLITRSRELVESLSGLDCLGAPAIADTANRLRQALCVDPDAVRADPSVRSAVANQAIEVRDILRKMGVGQ